MRTGCPAVGALPRPAPGCFTTRVVVEHQGILSPRRRQMQLRGPCPGPSSFVSGEILERIL